MSSISLIVAIITGIFLLISNKKSSKYSKELEKLKFVLSNESEFERAEINKKINCLHKMSETIQILKDDIKYLSNSVEDSIDIELTLDKIQDSIDNFKNIYAENHMSLVQINNRLKDRIHSGKNAVTLPLETEIIPKIRKKGKTTSGLRDKLKNIISELSDMDNLLMKSRINLLR